MAALQVLAGCSREGPLHAADDALAGFAHTLLVWAWAASARAAAGDEARVNRCRWAVAHFAPQGTLHWHRVGG